MTPFRSKQTKVKSSSILHLAPSNNAHVVSFMSYQMLLFQCPSVLPRQPNKSRICR